MNVYGVEYDDEKCPSSICPGKLFCIPATHFSFHNSKLKLHVTCIISIRKRYKRFPTTLEHYALEEHLFFLAGSQINRIYVDRRLKQKSEVAFSMIAF